MANSTNLKSPFFRYLVANNRPHLDNFKQWRFHPGMLFNSLDKWWGDQGARSNPHEGLDLCHFEETNGTMKTLDNHINIPAAFAGEIVKITPDFLGQSIYVIHDHYDDHGRQLYSAYGHTHPRDSLDTGTRVAAGEIIGVISGGSGNQTAMVPHLHITVAWIPAQIAPPDLAWDNLCKNPDIILIDPLAML